MAASAVQGSGGHTFDGQIRQIHKDCGGQPLSVLWRRRKIGLTCGRYALSGEQHRANILHSIRNAAQLGLTRCDEFRKSGEPDQRTVG